MATFRIAWRGQDLYDSIEEEGMTLTARACYLICCELVSTLRQLTKARVPEPWQDDGWASFEFSAAGQRVRCVVGFENEDDYLLTVYTARSMWAALFGRREPPLQRANVALIREVILKNPRLELLSEKAEDANE